MTSTAPKANRGSPVWPVLGAVAALAGLTAAALGALSLAAALTATGLPDPGPVTTLGLPFVRAAGEVAAALAVGGFLFAAFFCPPQDTGVLDADGYRALRLGTAACGVWAVCAALLVPLTVSDVSGEPLTGNLTPAAVWRAADLVDTASAWRATALLALLVTVAATAVLRWSPTPVLFAGAVLTLMPLALTGHSAAGGSHDLATGSLIIHLVAGAIWAGGLLALLAHALRGGAHTDLAARRFSAVALWCFAAMVLSGAVNTAVRIRLADLVSTPYGALVIAKVLALVLLGVIGWRQRRTAVVALQSDPDARAPLVRLAMAEALVFGVTFGIAVGLGRTPPPPPVQLNPSPVEVALGYDLAGPPTLSRIMLDWRFDVLFGTAALIMAAIYLVGVIRLRRRGDDWPAGRTVSWLLGCALLLFTTSSGVGRYMPAMFSMHMIGQILLSMLIPILLVLGAPSTLALRALPASGKGNPPGPREWLLAGLHSTWSRVFTHPVVATVMFVAGFYALYVGGIFNAAAPDHAAHVLMNIYFLMSGYLFFWVVIGIDPTPRPVPRLAKIGMVLASIPLHAFLGVILTGMTGILGERFYRSLQLPWHTDLSGDQHLGGSIAWAAGEVPLAVVLMALLIQWRRRVRRDGVRQDRAVGRDDGADTTADNATLAELARRER
ncbi:MAG: cytochrome c oxidase assembly protein [Mycobacterium sp.]